MAQLNLLVKCSLPGFPSITGRPIRPARGFSIISDRQSAFASHKVFQCQGVSSPIVFLSYLLKNEAVPAFINNDQLASDCSESVQRPPLLPCPTPGLCLLSE